MEILKKRSAYLLTIAAAAVGLLGAYRRAWTCDDAFISFRYALNLIQGRGLVYNAGEYVEGFTNASWTLLSALAMSAGLEPESAANALGILSFALLLGGMTFLGRWFIAAPTTTTTAVPMCVGALAIHAHMMIFATSGLETMAFTTLCTLGLLLVCRDYTRVFRDDNEEPIGTDQASRRSSDRGRFGFALLTLACLTRPDGLIFYGACSLSALYLEFRITQPTLFRNLILRLVRTHAWFLVLFPMALALRYWYYGSLVPNTYYAKSAYAGYWTQGLRYVGLYFQSYWILIPLPFLAGAYAITRARSRKQERAPRHVDPSLVLGLSCTFLWIPYIIRVGGDFMFARFLIPITPILYLLLEKFSRGLPAKNPALRQRIPALFFWVLILGTLLRFDPYKGRPLPRIHDISEENKIYTPERFRRLRDVARELKSVLLESKAIVAYVGAQAGLMYYWTPMTAIESETGLTDAFIARRRLRERGPIGHEKTAPIAYLRMRKTSFRMRPPPPERDRGFNRLRVRGFPADWEIVVFLPEVMDALKKDQRFRFPDFRDYLDAYVRNAPRPEVVRRDLEFFRAYYFDHTSDPGRLAELLILAGKD